MVRKGARRPKVSVDKTDVFFFLNGCDLRCGFGTGRQASRSTAAFLPHLSGAAPWQVSRALPLMVLGLFMERGHCDLKPAPSSP